MTSDLSVDEFYKRASWPLGTLVIDPANPDRHGTIVKRGGRRWVSRDKLPMVRWHGRIDAEPVSWHQLHRAGDGHDL